MSTLLMRNATLLASFDEQRREIPGGGLFARDGVIEAVAESERLPRAADRVLDCSGHVLLPGLVNTHHHLFQTLTRAVPAAQNAPLFDWLKTLYPIWARITPEGIHVSALLGMAELLLSGCTTTSDHLYLFPNGARLDDEIRAAQEIGIRFHAARGSMSVGQSQGGLPPDSLVEREDAILADTQRVIEANHDPARHAMLRIDVAPCSPFSVSRDLMRESASLARRYGVRLHTHLAENAEDVAYSRARFGLRPGEYAESLGWLGADVWHAHCVHLDAPEIDAFARTGTGIAHCPSSNMRLASGILPLARCLAKGVPVGLGVDGSASNDGSHLLGEARQALLLQRVGGDPAALGARQALEVATRGGARVLGRDDIGALAPGMAADCIAVDLNRIHYAGAHDPLAALLFCQAATVDVAVVNGVVLVEQGTLQALDCAALLRAHRRLVRALIDG